MEVVTGAGANIVTEIGKCSVKEITHHVGYVFHFKKNIDDLGKAKGELKLKYETVKADVERAKSNTEVVKNDVEDWLNRVKEVVEAVETLENKVCCNGWCPNWIWRYKQSKEATEKTATVNKALQDAGSLLQPFTYRAPTPGLEIFKSSDFEAFESRKSAFKQIMEALRDDNSNRIGLWGMGGVGKTTLVKEVNKANKELDLFSDIVMAVVSQTPDIRRIQDEIADCLHLKLEENSNSGRANRICMRIKNAQNILIILDDIWEEVNIEDIGVPSRHDHKGCKILITTRSEHVCNVMSCEKKFQLKVMTEEESLALFKKSACIDDDSLALNDDVVRQVVKECQGLPIAIVVVGKALIKKPLNDWNVALKQLRNSKLVEIEGVDEDKNAYVCLRWSYDRLKKNTKLCFLLCSLFPEDYNIPIEELIRYAIGLEVYDDVKSIEEGRSLICNLINSLKDSSLLLDAYFIEERVKMHDMVRDVALWIASTRKEELSLSICTRLENIKNAENATAISLWANNTKQLPEKLVCLKLNILSLGEIPNDELKNHELPEISDTFFEGMKGLKVFSLRNKFLSSQSLQFLTNLRCLYLVNCNFDNLSSLGKLKSLEILSFHSCRMVELPSELGELDNLKVLDLVKCPKLKWISPNLIKALSHLEELYVGSDSFSNWEVEGTSNASLSELMSLSNLVMLSLNFNEKSLPKDFVFPKLQRYEVYIAGVSSSISTGTVYPKSRLLSIFNVDLSSPLNAFKELFCTVEELWLSNCKVECFIDTTGRNNTFSNLVNLNLYECSRLTNLFSPSLVQNLEKLESLTLQCCSELKQIISEEEMSFKCHHIQPPCFPKLRRLWLIDCGKLEYLFSISVARGFLLQLEELKIKDLPNLKQVFGNEREGGVGLDENKFELSKLRKLSLQNLPKFSNFFQGNTSSTWPSLEELSVLSCPKMTPSFVTNLEDNVQVVGKVLKLSNCSQLCNTFLDLLTQGLFDLEELKIESCGGLEDLFLRERLLPSRLKNLSLKDLLVQRCVWKGPTQLVNPNNLKKFKVCQCNRLRQLFSLATLARSFQQLEDLTIKECDELEHLIAEDKEDQIFSEDHLQPLYFPKLRNVVIKDCHKMKSIFPIAIAHTLQQLYTLEVKGASQLVKVFAHEYEGDVGIRKNIRLHMLWKLTLDCLPSLVSFCPMNYHFILPHLNFLNVLSCPNMSTSFSPTPDFKTDVHVNGEEYVISIGSYFHDSYFRKDYSKSRVLRLVDVDAPSMNAFKVFFWTVEELKLEKCGVECFNDTTRGNNNVTFSNLVKLILKDMPSLRTMWEGPIQKTTFGNLSVLKARSCSRLTNLFSPSLVQNLEKLETLILENCHELKQIISEEEMLFKCHHIQPPCFPKLSVLEVINCGKLEYLFSNSVAQGFLMQLQKLIVKDLPELKQIFGDEREGEVGLDGNKFKLSKLRKLSLQNLPKLGNFFQGNTSSTWPSLEKLSLMRCPKMIQSFVADLVASLHTVEKRYVISIGSNFTRNDSKSRFLRVVDANASTLDALKVFFSTVRVLELEKCEVECFIDTVTLSNLVKLILKDMPSLRTMWEGPIQQTTFRNLTVLEARSCNRLTNLFSPSLVQNLEKLETLIIEKCHELKQIISEEKMLFKCHHIQPPCFPKLRVLEVIDCGKLKYLFSISVAQGFFMQLQKLIVKDLPELKQVFCEEREGEVGLDGNKFELSKLTELSLQNLPKLTNFFQGNISSTWPSLERLSVMSCPEMTPSFVTNLEDNVRAVEKKLQVLNVSNCNWLCNTVLDLLSQGLSDSEELKIESCGGLEDLFERERLLPSRLKILRLKDLLVQKCVWKGPTQLVNLNNLKKFEVCRCNRLRQLFSPATLARSLQQLESLTIAECDELEHLIAEDEEDQILLEGHPELVYLKNLKSFRVFKCNRLRHLFIPTLARSLQQLDSLTIEECDELEHLIADDEEDQILSKGHLQPLYFSKLSDVVVEDCNNMKSLFPITIAYSLQKLSKLRVEGASQLVEVFVHKDEGDVEVRKDIKLPMLWELTLKHLPSLVSFCPRNYHFILPSLQYLYVLSCPNMSTSFARTPNVHVNGEVPQLDKKDEHTVLSATSEVVAARPTNKDIYWSRDWKPNALPLFKKESPK